MAVPKELWVAYSRIFFVELAYWIVSISMVFINEFVLNDGLLTDDLTVFVTIFQILFSLSILITMNYLTQYYLNPVYQSCKTEELMVGNQRQSPESSINGNEKDSVTLSINSRLNDDNQTLLLKSTKDDNNNIDGSSDSASRQKRRRNLAEDNDSITSKEDQDGLTQLIVVNIPERINLETCKLVFPLSILYIGMLLLNNFCLKYVGVAFYFVSRSLTTVFNVTFTYFILNEPVSRGALVCCGFIILGFILGVDQESVIGSLSVVGVVFGVTSSLFTSLFSIYTKKTLAKLDRNIWTLVLYNNINAIILCTPLLIAHGDIQSLISDKVISPAFWLLLSISGVMAFLISIVTNASIKYTSPLTHNISGTAKACLQTVIAVIYRHNHKSSLWWLSNFTILIASAFYSRIKQKEMEQKASIRIPVSSSTPYDEIGQISSHLDPDSKLEFQKKKNSSSSNACSAVGETSLNDMDYASSSMGVNRVST